MDHSPTSVQKSFIRQLEQYLFDKTETQKGRYAVLIELLFLTILGILIGVLFWYAKPANKSATVISPIQEKRHQNEILVTEPNKTREIIGFVPSWTVAQNQKIHIEPLTQLIYFGLGVTENGEIIKFDEDNAPVLEWQYFTSREFKKIVTEAKENGTKVLIAFKNFDNTSIDTLISNDLFTSRFIKSVSQLILEYDLDGINLDFEYVTDTDFPTAKYFNKFLASVSSALKNGNPKLLVSIDVNATAILKDSAYDMVKIGEVVDHVIVMAYDYRQANSTRAGPVAPLYGSKNEHSIHQSIQSLNGRVEPHKIILGIPYYGYEWQTINTQPKSFTINNSGALATYKRVRELIDSRKDIIYHWDSKAQSPWLVYRQNGAIKEIYYENEKSISAKRQYMEDQQLGGIAVWALGYEGIYTDIWKAIKEE